MSNRRAQRKLIDAGFTEIGMPETGIPKAPTNVTALDGEKLGDVISLFSVWREYTEDLLARRQMELSLLQHEYDFEFNLMWLATTKTGTLEDKKKTIATDQKIHTLNTALLQAQMFVDALIAKVESYSNILAMLSREISRRTGRVF